MCCGHRCEVVTIDQDGVLAGDGSGRLCGVYRLSVSKG